MCKSVENSYGSRNCAHLYRDEHGRKRSKEKRYKKNKHS